MSPRPAYRREARRTGDVWEVAELLVEAVRPALVVLVCSDAVDSADIDTTRTEMAADGLREVEVFRVGNGNDAEAVLADLDRRIADYCAAGNRWDGADLAVDVTGGTVPISLALLRVAALAGAVCVYVAKEQRGREIVAGTQRARQFDPRTFAGALPS
jgi:hypothetical protein